MKKPNFFIVGAPKCGTSALVHYLRGHPNVFISAIKEPRYFAEDFPRYRRIADERNYLALFEDATDEHKLIGEASARYLYSQDAVKNIRAFDKHAKLIVMLRNPVDMVYSYHSQVLFDREENVSNFAEAWHLIDKRKNGDAIPKSCREKKLLYYDEIAKFGEQLERLYTHFPKDQVLLVYYDDFSSNTRPVYFKILDFLGVPKDARSNFPVINANKQNRSAMIAQFTQRPPAILSWTAQKVKGALGIRNWGALDFLRAANRVDKPRVPLDHGLRQEIIDCYRDDIAKLSAITGRDLGHWLL